MKDTEIKRIEFVTGPEESHWVGDGFHVNNFIPYGRGLSMRDMDPFIMLDYNSKMNVRPSARPKGVGVHPHRGFETVTIAYHGEVEHHDSAGNHGVIRSGDVQWMTAASGVLHKEYHSRGWSQKGGLFQMVQLWVNLPASVKGHVPRYQAIAQSQMGVAQLPDNGGTVEVIAGNYKGTKGPAKTFSPVELMNARLNMGGTAEFDFPAHYHTALLVVEGEVTVNGTRVPQDHLVKFANRGERFSVSAQKGNAVALVMSGEPLNEPIVAHGPFVMNTENEIYQAIHDMQTGRFGHLDD